MVFYFRVATFMTTYRKCYSCKGPDASIGQTNRQTNVGSWTSPPLHPLPAGCPGLWPLVSNSWDQFCGIPQPDVRHVRPHSCGRRPRSRHPFPCCPRLAHHCQTVHDPEEGDWKAKKILANCSHLLNYISHVIAQVQRRLVGNTRGPETQQSSTGGDWGHCRQHLLDWGWRWGLLVWTLSKPKMFSRYGRFKYVSYVSSIIVLRFIMWPK